MSKTTSIPTDSTDYKNLIDLMALVSEASVRLAMMSAEVQSEFLGIVDDKRKDYAELQEKITKAEASVELIARRHPEWFQSSRSIKTPYGVVKFHESTKLDVPNEEASVILIESKCSEEERAKYLRTDTRLNIEALEKLTDVQLEQFRINRVKVDNFSMKPAAVDLGKAVKEAVSAEDKIEEARRKV